MSADRALSLLDQMLWTAAIMAGPVLAGVLIVGVAISILQVATQVQEMTLTFVPKQLVAVLMLIFLGSWMMRQLTQFAQGLFLAIPWLAQ